MQKTQPHCRSLQTLSLPGPLHCCSRCPQNAHLSRSPDPLNDLTGLHSTSSAQPLVDIASCLAAMTAVWNLEPCGLVQEVLLTL